MHTPRFSLLVIALLSIFSTFSTRAEQIKAGVAQTDITPPVGYRLAGYFNERLSTGIHDPLLAKAIVLQDKNEKIAMVFCDILGLSLNISTNVRAQASAKTGIPYKNIVIAGTHSHTGPLFEGVIRDFLHKDAIAKTGKDPREEIDYSRFLIAQIVKAIVEANAHMQPSSVEIGIGKQYGVSFNRRYRMKDGRVAFNPGILNTNIVAPAGPMDPDVGILLVRDVKTKTARGGLTVFAAHADTVGGTEYSADYPFFISETLKKNFGSNYISAFAAGTCGDINHINVKTNEGIKGFKMAEKIGTNLAATVVKELPRLEKINEPAFAVHSEKILAPLKDVPAEKLADAREKIKKIADNGTGFFVKVDAVRDLDIAEKGTTWPLEVQVFRLNKDTAIVALPCEIFVELGLAIKKDSPFKNTFVMTVCNDRPSYVPTRKAFAEGSYEINNARVKAGTGEMLVETSLKLLKSF